MKKFFTKNWLLIFFIALVFSALAGLSQALYMTPQEAAGMRLATMTVYQGATSGQYSDSIELKAALSEKVGGGAIAGKKIEFFLEKQQTSAITNSQGLAAASLTLNQGAGNYTLLAVFSGDEFFNGSSDSNTFTILKEETAVSYNGPLSAVQDATVVLKARLSEKDGQVGDLAGKRVVFDLASLSVIAATDSLGNAQAELILNLSPNNYTLNVKFEGDAVYLSSADTAVFEVKAKSGGGGGGRGSCFIATAVYGSPLAAELDILREFRDRHLLTNRTGQWLVSRYYKYSPPLANYIAQKENLKKALRGLLSPIIETVKTLIKKEND